MKNYSQIVFLIVLSLFLFTGCDSSTTDTPTEVESASESEVVIPEDAVFVHVDGLSDEQYKQISQLDEILYYAEAYMTSVEVGSADGVTNIGIHGLSDFMTTYQDNDQIVFDFVEDDLINVENSIVMREDLLVEQGYSVGDSITGTINNQDNTFTIVGTFDYGDYADSIHDAFVGPAGYETLTTLYNDSTNSEMGQISQHHLIQINSEDDIPAVEAAIEAELGIDVTIYVAYNSKDGVLFNIQ